MDDFVLMNFRNGRKIIGRKKKNIPNSKSMYDITSETAIMETVSGHPDHLIDRLSSLYDNLKIIGRKNEI